MHVKAAAGRRPTRACRWQAQQVVHMPGSLCARAGQKAAEEASTPPTHTPVDVAYKQALDVRRQRHSAAITDHLCACV